MADNEELLPKADDRSIVNAFIIQLWDNARKVLKCSLSECTLDEVRLKSEYQRTRHTWRIHMAPSILKLKKKKKTGSNWHQGHKNQRGTRHNQIEDFKNRQDDQEWAPCRPQQIVGFIIAFKLLQLTPVIVGHWSQWTIMRPTWNFSSVALNVPAYIWHLSTHNAGIINENNTILSMQTIWALVYWMRGLMRVLIATTVIANLWIVP